MNNLRRLAFELITELCFEASGDGDSAIISEQYKELANEYEIWVNEKYPNRFIRNDSVSDCIIFSSLPEENVCFTNSESNLPVWIDNRLVHPWL